MFPSLPPPSNPLRWAVGAAFLALALFAGKLYADRAELQAELAQAKTELAQAREASAKQVAAITDDYRARETGLTQKMTQQEAAANETIASLTRRADRLAASLRDAQRRASQPAVPSTAPDSGADQAAGGGDGPLVPAEIGEQDVAEALRADTIRVELMRCYAAYDAAAEALALPNPTPNQEVSP